ncbi:MAG: hypothetical protein ACK5NU_05665 [Fusobacterium ulcerans]
MIYFGVKVKNGKVYVVIKLDNGKIVNGEFENDKAYKEFLKKVS